MFSSTTFFSPVRCTRPTSVLARYSSYKDMKCSSLVPGSKPFTGQELISTLKDLKGWDLHEGNKIIRRFDVKNFVNGVEFIGSLATMAEEEGHHPDVHLTEYKNLAVVYWSHDVGGLSKNDIICAAKVDELWEKHIKNRKE